MRCQDVGCLGQGARMSLELVLARVGRVPEIYPFLAVKDVDGAVTFYTEAFGATEGWIESSRRTALKWRDS